MIPPSFSDLGKAAKDLFDKNFKFGKLSVDMKTKSSQGVEMNVKGDHVMKDGKLSGNMEAIYKWQNELKTTLKWDTTKKLFSNISIEDVVQNGTKLSADVSFHPDSGEKSLKTTTTFKRDLVNFGLISDFRGLKPIVTPSLVIGCTGDRAYLLGAEAAYDTSRMVLNRHKLALGYQTKELSMVAILQNLTEVETLIHQKISDKVELGIKINWARNSRDPEFGVVGRYNFEKDSFIKAKIDNNTRLGFAYGFKSTDKVDVTFNTELDGKNLESGAHKFGVELSYAP